MIQPSPETLEHLAAQSIESLPIGVDAVAAIALAAGLLMWLVGRRFVKPLFFILSAAGGAALGFLGPTYFDLGWDTNIVMTICAIAGAIVSIALYRLSMGIMLAAALGVALPTATAVVITLKPSIVQSNDTTDTLDELQQFLDGVPIELQELSKDKTPDNPKHTETRTTEETTSATKEILHRSADRVRSFINELMHEAKAHWDDTPPKGKLLLTLSTLVGLLMGFLIGLIKPKHVAAVSTACAGAAAWLPSAVFLLRSHNIPGSASLPDSPRVWLIVWLVIAFIGTTLQWTALRPKADNKKSNRD